MKDNRIYRPEQLTEAEKETLDLTQAEARELAENLDWGDPTEDPEDILDSLRTNWEQPLSEKSVQMVYAEMIEIWKEAQDD